MKRIFWRTVFAVVLEAIITQMLLTLAGLGICLGTIDPPEKRYTLAGLAIRSTLWCIRSRLLSLFIVSWSTGQ